MATALFMNVDENAARMGTAALCGRADDGNDTLR